jgi:hypothetical protein
MAAARRINRVRAGIAMVALQTPDAPAFLVAICNLLFTLCELSVWITLMEAKILPRGQMGIYRGGTARKKSITD